MNRFAQCGALAGWEFRRLARRGQLPRAWFVLYYSFFLAFIIFTLFWYEPRSPLDVFRNGSTQLAPEAASVFSSRLALVLLQLQLAGVAVAAPVLAAAAIAREKDRQTLPLLLATPLTDREIVWGKAIGRVLFVLAVVMGGLPVTALLWLYLDADAEIFSAGYLLIFGTAALCVGIGVNAACRTPDFRTAVLRAFTHAAVLVFGLFVPPFVLATPFALLYFTHGVDRQDTLLFIAAYVVLQLLLSVLLLLRAARSLRLREATAGPPPRSSFPLPPRPAEPLLVRSTSIELRPHPPLDDADPISWKERCLSWRPQWVVPAVVNTLSLLMTALAAVLLISGTWVVFNRVGTVYEASRSLQQSDRVDVPDLGGALLLAAGVISLGRYLLSLAVGVSGTIAGERHRGTLDSLLATPLNRRRILRSKVQAHAERGTVFLAVAVAAIGMAFTADGGIRLGAAAALFVLAAAGLIIGLGALFTVRCETETRAFRRLVWVAILAAIMPAGVWNLLRFEAYVPRQMLILGLTMLIGVCAVVGGYCWLLACRGMERGD